MNSMKRHKSLIILLLVILVIGIAFGVMRGRGTKGAVVGQVKHGDILEAVYGIGTVTASKTFQLKVGITSQVRDIFVREGDTVKKGAKLVSLEGGTTFTAPFAGTVTSLPYKPGETVFPQTPILTLTDLLDRYLVVSLEQQGAIRVEHGQAARINFESMRDQTFTGTVEAVYSFETNFLVRIAASNLPPRILPGMTADVAIAIRKHENSLIVPASAVSRGAVYVQRGGKNVVVPVKTGITDGDMTEVTSGELRDGEVLLLPGS